MHTFIVKCYPARAAEAKWSALLSFRAMFYFIVFLDFEGSSRKGFLKGLLCGSPCGVSQIFHICVEMPQCPMAAHIVGAGSYIGFFACAHKVLSSRLHRVSKTCHLLVTFIMISKKHEIAISA